MRVLIWHGYLLDGTGSNVYTRSLARVWARDGHDVTVICQEPHPERYDLGGARVVRPQLDGPLPVFVLDDYAEATPRLLGDLSWADREHFVEVNARAVRDELPADLLLVNHVLLGAPVGAASGAPFVVKAHGSELEFAIRGDEELADWARRTLDEARRVVAGSEHIVDVLEEVVGGGDYAARVEVVPPGVDTDELRPQDRGEALAALLEECRRDEPNPPEDHDERRPDDDNAERLEELFGGDAPTVVYVGKLSEEKGVSLLLEAIAPLDVRAVIVGFGPARDELEQMAGANVAFTGPLEHRHLAHLWPLADVSVTPSVFPEAFGMVAAEAASCGSPPLVARHSGLAEVAARLEETYPDEHAHLASFPTGDVDALRARIEEIVALPTERWGELSRAARRTAELAWSWRSVADRLAELAER